MINLSKLQWIVVGVVVLIVIVLLDVLIGTTITPRLIAAPTPTPPMPTNVLFVKPEANGDCRENWFHACDLQTALSKALPGEEIWVARGVYKPGTQRTDTFKLSNHVSLYGGFLGIETSRDQRDWETNLTILSGDIGTTGDSSDNSYHVVTGSGTATTAVLDGFTITEGFANGGSPNDRGGGMYNNNGSPMLTNVTFSKNYGGDWGGGGIFNDHSNPILTSVIFSENTTPGGGGGMRNLNSSPMLTDVTFSGNSAKDGGGMQNSSNSRPTLFNVIFSGNSAYRPGFGTWGGGMEDNVSSSTLINVTFSGNSASQGGGMGVVEGSPTLINVTFSGNSASQGGGMACDLLNEGSPTLVNVTFSGNSVTYQGGGIWCHGERGMGTGVTVHNSILWGNTAPDGPQIYNLGSTSIISHSLVQGSGSSGPDWDSSLVVDGGGNLNEDPLFVDPPSNLRLQSTSPAIDAGNNAAVPARVTTDLDGKPRFVCETVDMGAYEYQTENCSQE
jgi:predicted outer membrane repeat protein